MIYWRHTEDEESYEIILFSWGEKLDETYEREKKISVWYFKWNMKKKHVTHLIEISCSTLWKYIWILW